jgi:serine/threonine protein kinase
MPREAPPAEVCAQVPAGGQTASATPDDGVGGPVRRLPRGATLGRYVVLDCLGSGGMGVVYRAHDFALDRRVSLKLLRSGGKDAEARRERLILEAQALARVSHPNVLAVHDVGTWDDEVYLALEHVEGETLAEWLRRSPRTAAEIRGAFLQAARGLQAIHEAGLVHRDVKPENILVGRDGRVRVADLGLAVTAGGAAAPAYETLRPGTPGYMPLEQHRGESLDARADQFSLAVALHEALLGERPYGTRGTSREALETRLATGVPAEVPHAIPPRLRRELARALQPDRVLRADSLVPLIDALTSPGMTVRRRLAWPTLAAAAVALLIVPALSAPRGPEAMDGQPWMPPVTEFATESFDSPTPLVDRLATPGPSPAWTAEVSRLALAAAVPVVHPRAAPAVTRPGLLVIGQRFAETTGTAPAGSPVQGAARLGELKKLLEALVEAVTEHHEGDGRPLLALGAPAAQPPVAPGAGATASTGQTELAQLSGTGGASSEWDDLSTGEVDLLERRLSLQIEQHRSTSVIAETRFSLAQAIWDSSDSDASPTDCASAQATTTTPRCRALVLARQSKAALATVAAYDPDPSVQALAQTVDDWLNEREDPVTKPRGGRLSLNPNRLP